MKGMVSGILCLVFGILTLIYWWGDLLSIIKGILPVALIVFGLMALSTGISMIKEPEEKDKKSTDK